MPPTHPPRARRRAGRRIAWHAATLTSFAVAQPLFQLLGDAPEFLVAHQAQPSEIIALTFTLGVIVPALVGTIVWMAGRLSPNAERFAGTAIVAALITLIGLLALRRWESVNGWIPIAAALSIAAMATVAYSRLQALRLFVTWLTPAVVVFPVLFLLRPGIASMVWPQDARLQTNSNATAPVVMIVFDQLPLTSLLDAGRHIDRRLYPSFAALADDATWYRNATTVSDYTRWALPSIVTGRHPVSSRLPVSAHHPESIFTLLGSSHRLRVFEPITQLCPETLCPRRRRAIVGRTIAIGRTLSIAYLHAVLPASFGSALPPIDQGWTDTVPTESIGELWFEESRRGRRQEVLEFIDAIDVEDPQPTFYFLHVLLPHEPFIYLPNGQRFSNQTTMPGLFARERWREDEWAVVQAYRRHLLQLGSVDALLGQLVARLKEVGLYDRALVVVTSDHGASFRAGLPFRRVHDATFMDILPVPLLIKQPNQQGRGIVSDRNVETIDILPTMAELLAARLSWKVDGISAMSPGPLKQNKSAFHEDAGRVRTFGPSLLADAYAAVDRKLALFGSSEENYFHVPKTSPYHELIGRKVAELGTSHPTDAEFAVEVHGDFTQVDPDSAFLPAYLAGRARARDGQRPVTLAVAVNGTIRATTRTYQVEGSWDKWSTVLGADAFRPGENQLEIFVVGLEAGAPVLHLAFRSSAQTVDLTSPAAEYGLGVRSEGLYDEEWLDEASFRWSNGAARLVVPLDVQRSPRSLRVSLAMSGRDGKPLRVRINGCDLFNGTVPAGPWYRVFGLSACPAGDGEAVIELVSGTDQSSRSAGARPLGVAIERIDLLESDWPPSAAPLPESARRSGIDLESGADRDLTMTRTASIAARIVNRGTSLWPSAGDLGQEAGSVWVGVLWFRPGESRQAAGVQQINLPRTLFPGDAIDIDLPLRPTAPDGVPLPAGRYDVRIALIQDGVGLFSLTGDTVRNLAVIVKD